MTHMIIMYTLMTQSYAWHDLSAWRNTFLSLTWLIHDIWETWLIWSLRTLGCVWHDSFTWRDVFTVQYPTWHIQVINGTHSYVWYDTITTKERHDTCDGCVYLDAWHASFQKRVQEHFHLVTNIRIYVHLYMYTYIHIYIHTYTYICIHILVHIYAHATTYI